MKLTITTSSNCAWRAVYFRWQGQQFAHIGVDPTTDNGPKCFGRAGRFSWRFNLPTVRYAYPMGPIRRFAYQTSSRFWHGLDGRNYRNN